MGNSQTKEARAHGGNSSRHESAGGSPAVGHDPNTSESTGRRSQHTRRGSRHDFSFLGLGLGSNNEQDASSLEARRENKAEREARKIEREKQARLKERERSMAEEHVDGGYLVTQGVYVGTEDYNKTVVRQLMIERRLAPFWRGLNDFSESWAEHQLMAAARGMSIPPADQVPPELEYTLTKRQTTDLKVKNMTVPITSRSQSFQSDISQPSPGPNSLPLVPALGSATSPTTPLFRARAKTLASLTTSRHNGSADATPREFQLPPDPFVNGQPIEVYLYKDATECPICFLYYPPYLNTTRCCEQPICSECFVQIKRPDPHPPEHEQPDPNAPPISEEERLAQAEGLLVSEVATCPYCKQPEFGITYVPPTFRRGLTYGAGSQPLQTMSPMSSQTSLSSGQISPVPGRRRGTSLSASAPEVITTDKVRPDWAAKLHAARAHAARRSAAATALHTAAYMMGPQDRLVFSGFGRRGTRRPTLEGEPAAEVQRHALAFLADRNSPSGGNAMVPPPRGSSSRRSRIDDIEELMMIEAIRMSLASEEERRKKEEKEAKKKAKKEEKENRKAEKAAKKSSTIPAMPSSSLEPPLSLERSLSNNSLLAPEVNSIKGKGIDRDKDSIEDEIQRNTMFSSSPGASQDSLSVGVPIPLGSEPFRRSHLRQMSNASSASSSYMDPGVSSGTPPGSTPNEPMFNFRSLTAMINEDEKRDGSPVVEHRENEIERQPSLENLDERPIAGSFPLIQIESASKETNRNAGKPEVKVEHTNGQTGEEQNFK